MKRPGQFLFLVVFMILYVVLGTLLHESGHIFIARLLGFHSILHYSSMDWYMPDGSPGSHPRYNFYIDLGGVILPDAISLIALVLLVWKGKRLSQWLFWILVFFSMLIYRHIVLTLICLGLTIMRGRQVAYGSDETDMAHYLNVPNSVIGVPLLIAAVISVYVLFFIVLDENIRYRLMIAAGIGGIIGYVVWLSYIGPAVMP